MSVWLCRAGRYGEHEARFLEDSQIYYTFEEIDKPLSSFPNKKALREYFVSVRPTLKERAADVYARQGYVFCQEMKPGDWIVTPSKSAPDLLRFAEITGEYSFLPDGDEVYRHARSVRWFAEVRRDKFEQDIQYSLGAAVTICKIKQEERIRAKVSSASSYANCTEVFTPPPEIWRFCQPTQFPSTSFATSRVTGLLVS